MRSTAIKQAQNEIGLPLSIDHAASRARRSPSRPRSSNELLLILAAIVTVYIVLGVLYESFIHPITILSTLPSAGIGALLALMLARQRPQHHRDHRHHPADRHREEERDHDDRLRARRRAQRGQAAARGDLPGVPAALPADHDDHDGGVLGALPLMLGTGAGSELRHPLGITIVGGLMVSQVLTLFTTPVIYLCFDRLAHRALPAAPASAQPGRRAACSHEPLGALHPPAGRDHAADVRARAGRHRGVLQAAGVAAAAGRLPDHLGAGDAARREPARRWRPPSRAPLERHLGQIADVTEMTSSSSLGSTRITLQFGLNRDIDGAARDVQAAINAARADLPTSLRSNPTYRKVNPADAPILILALTSDTLTPRPALRRRLDGARAEAVAGRRRRRGRWSAAARCRRCASSSIPQALYKYGIGLEDVRAALASANAHSPKGAHRRRRQALPDLRQRPGQQGRRLQVADRRLPQRRGGAALRRRRGHRLASRTCATPASPTASRRC